MLLFLLLLSVPWLPPLCWGADPPDSRQSGPQLSLPWQEDDFTIYPAQLPDWTTEATVGDLVCAAVESEFSAKTASAPDNTWTTPAELFTTEAVTTTEPTSKPPTTTPRPTTSNDKTTSTGDSKTHRTRASLSCEEFVVNSLCLSHMHNLLGRHDTDNEVSCQRLCSLHDDCKYFTMMESKHPSPEETGFLCYLWRECGGDIGCVESGGDCQSSVRGPARPPLPEACCHLFQQGYTCSSPPVISLPPMGEEVCQLQCRKHSVSHQCRFYTSTPTSCLLHEVCDKVKTEEGASCGPVRPPRGTLQGNRQTVVGGVIIDH